MRKEEKTREIEFLEGVLKCSQMVVFANYQGLTVKKMNELRREIKASGGLARVVKNTLARRAADTALTDLPEEDKKKLVELFKGPNLLASVEEDVVALAKVFTKFSKESEKLEIKGGVYNGRFVTPKDVADISRMPSREELLAKLLSLMNAPAQRIMSVMKAPAEQLVRVLNAYKEKIEGK